MAGSQLINDILESVNLDFESEFEILQKKFQELEIKKRQEEQEILLEAKRQQTEKEEEEKIKIQQAEKEEEERKRIKIQQAEKEEEERKRIKIQEEEEITRIEKQEEVGRKRIENQERKKVEDEEKKKIEKLEQDTREEGEKKKKRKEAKKKQKLSEKELKRNEKAGRKRKGKDINKLREEFEMDSKQIKIHEEDFPIQTTSIPDEIIVSSQEQKESFQLPSKESENLSSETINLQALFTEDGEIDFNKFQSTSNLSQDSTQEKTTELEQTIPHKSLQR